MIIIIISSSTCSSYCSSYCSSTCISFCTCTTYSISCTCSWCFEFNSAVGSVCVYANNLVNYLTMSYKYLQTQRERERIQI